MTETAGAYVGPDWDWADRLRKIRRTVACVSQAEMARLIDVKPATYSAWEGGRNEPPMRLAYQVAQRIEQQFPGRVSAAWVLGFESINGERAGLLPRMDSNHQPCGYRPHADQSTLRPNDFGFFSDGVSHDLIPLPDPLSSDPRYIPARTL